MYDARLNFYERDRLDIVDQCNEIGIDTCALEAPSPVFASNPAIVWILPLWGRCWYASDTTEK